MNHYRQGRAQSNPHSDDESYVDTESPICTFSLGADRNFYIYKKLNGRSSPKVDLIKSLMLQNNSLTVMIPPSQVLTRHQIQPGVGERWSLSFRRVVKSEINASEWPYLIPSKPLATGNTTQSTPISSKRLPSTPSFSNINTPSRKNSVSNILIPFTPEEQITRLLESADLETCMKVLLVAKSRINELETKKTQITNEEVEALVRYIPEVLTSPSEHIDISSTVSLVNDAVCKDTADADTLIEI